VRRGWLLGIGIPLLVLGVVFAGGLSQDHSLCSSGLGVFANPNECAATNLAFYGGLAAIILGLILIAAAAFGGRGHSHARSVRPRGYAAPGRVRIRLDRVSVLLIGAIAILLLAAVGIGTYMVGR
jgi:hypothetical protein